MTQDKYQDKLQQSRQQRPAECFEPGFDAVWFKSQEATAYEKKTMEKMTMADMQASNPAIKMSYAEAREAAYNA